jgi:hypothetical protein
VDGLCAHRSLIYATDCIIRGGYRLVKRLFSIFQINILRFSFLPRITRIGLKSVPIGAIRGKGTSSSHSKIAYPLIEEKIWRK